MQSLDELLRMIQLVETRPPGLPPGGGGGSRIVTGRALAPPPPGAALRPRAPPLAPSPPPPRPPPAGPPRFRAPLRRLPARDARARGPRARARGRRVGRPDPGALLRLPPLAPGGAARAGVRPQPPRRPLTRRAPRLVRPRPRDARPPGGRGPRRARPSLGTGGSRAGTRVLPGRARRRPRGPHRPPGALAPGALGEARRPVGPGVRALGGRRTSRRVRSGALGGAREVSRASPAGPPHGARDRLAGARARPPRGRAARRDRPLCAPAVAPGAPSSEARRQDTGGIGGRPSRTAPRLRTARVVITMRGWPGTVALGGASTTFWSGTRSGWIFGSSSKTSRPAPAIQPSRRARASTASSTMGPRAAFTRTADFRIRRSVRSPMRCRVSGVRLVWSVTKSASRRSVSRSVAVAESSRSTAASARTASW